MICVARFLAVENRLSTCNSRLWSTIGSIDDQQQQCLLCNVVPLAFPISIGSTITLTYIFFLLHLVLFVLFPGTYNRAQYFLQCVFFIYLLITAHTSSIASPRDMILLEACAMQSRCSSDVFVPDRVTVICVTPRTFIVCSILIPFISICFSGRLVEQCCPQTTWILPIEYL